MLFLLSKKFYKKNYLILAILVLAVLLRMVYLDDSYVFWDESIYLMNGEALANQPAGYTELDFRPPLLPMLIAPFALFPDYYALLSKLFMILINTILVVFAYIFGKQFNKNIGLLSSFLVSILPYHLMSSSWVMTDGLAAVLLLLTILLYFKGFKQDKNSLIYLGGFFLSLAVLAKLTNLLLIILLLPLVLFNLKKIKVVLQSFLVSLLTFLPYLVVNYLVFGNPFHGILKAFKIGNVMLGIVGAQPVGAIIKVFYDFFGIVLSVLIFAGVLLFVKEEILSQKDVGIRKENTFLVYCFFIFLPYYVYTVHEGATPIWWDPQRFLLSFLPFGILFSAYFIIKIAKNFSNKPKVAALTFLIILILLSWNQQYARFIQPAVNYEDGLRHVTKEMGLYLKNEDTGALLCLGNCPPIAYYSNKKTSIVYDIKNFKLKPHQYGIIFSDNIGKLDNPYKKIKTLCENRWCVYALKNV